MRISVYNIQGHMREYHENRSLPPQRPRVRQSVKMAYDPPLRTQTVAELCCNLLLLSFP
jgi:hypothetical protein